MPGRLVDGNDAAAVHQVLAEAVAHARAGGGPTLVEAVTYRIDAHTNADDATRYRGDAEVETWRAHDPIALLEHELTERGLLDEDGIRAARDAAETMAADLRERMNQDPVLDPMDLFAHVYAEPTPQLREQEALLRAELAATHERLAKQAAHFMGEMRRIGGAAAGQSRRAVLADERRSLVDRVAHVRVSTPATRALPRPALPEPAGEDKPADPGTGHGNANGSSNGGSSGVEAAPPDPALPVAGEAAAETPAAPEMPQPSEIPEKRRRPRLLDRITGATKG